MKKVMIGTQIKKLRTARRLSQVELGKALGVSKQSVSNWENDNILPSVEIIIKLSKFFSCSADYLLELSDENKSCIDTSKLTDVQAAHIQQLVKDFEEVQSHQQHP